MFQNLQPLNLFEMPFLTRSSGLNLQRSLRLLVGRARVHDADLEDEKFHRLEGFGIEQIFKGLAKQGLKDHEILSRGFECFEALYAQFKRS